MTEKSPTMRLIAEAQTPAPSGGAPVTAHLFEVGMQPEIYIDGMQGAVVTGTIVKLNCFTRGFNPPTTEAGAAEERFANARLVMGVDTFVSVVDWLIAVRNEMSARDPFVRTLIDQVNPQKTS